MDKKITDIFPWQHAAFDPTLSTTKVANSLSDQMVLCLDRNPSGGDFSFDMLVSSLLVKGARVILLAFNHPKQHYELILHNNGVNMGKCQQSDRLHFLPVRAGETFPPPASDGTSAPTLSSTFPPDTESAPVAIPVKIGALSTAEDAQLLFSLSPEWQPLAAHILTVLRSLPTESNVAICVDDLLALQLYSTNKQARRFISVLHSLLSSRQIATLVLYGKAYAEADCSIMQSETFFQPQCGSIAAAGSQGSGGGTGVQTFCTSAGSSGGDEEDEVPLYAYCLYRATVSVIVSPLSTGYAMDIHGQILIHAQNANTDTVVSYKALDSGVSCAIIK